MVPQIPTDELGGSGSGIVNIKPELVTEDPGHETPPSEPTPEEMSPSSDDYEVRDLSVNT